MRKMSEDIAKRSTQKLRLISRIILLLLMAVHMITWYIMGIRVVGSIGIEAMFYGLSHGLITAGLVFWVLVFIATILFGRAFCGWFCWFGGYLELSEYGMEKANIKVPRRAVFYLAIIPFVSLLMQIYYAWLVNWVAGIPGSFVVRLDVPQPWGQTQTLYSIIITLIVYGPVLVYVFGRRPWCRYLCPIGALLKVFGSVSLGKVRLVSDECTGCGTCNRKCIMLVDVMGELSAYGEVRDSNCIRCMECTDNCPTDAIAFTMRNKGITLTEEAASRAERSSLKRRKRSGFDVAMVAIWTVVIVAIAWSGLRQDTPIEIKTVMTVGMLIAVYGVTLALRRIWDSRKTTQATKLSQTPTP